MTIDWQVSETKNRSSGNMARGARRNTMI